MYYDFEYNGISLSDKGYVVCSFENNLDGTVSLGSELVFNTIPVNYGTHHELSSTQYDKCLSCHIQICKKICGSNEDIELKPDDIRDLSRWLNKKKFNKLKFLSYDMLEYYYMASFNLSKIVRGGRIIGIELEIVTDSPFAYKDNINLKYTINSNTNCYLNTESDCEEIQYPKVKIKVKDNGTLTIRQNNGDEFILPNCSNGEVLSFEYPIIETTLSTHNVYNDFNYNFLVIQNKDGNSQNVYTPSLDCEIEFTYSPMVKIGI